MFCWFLSHHKEIIFNFRCFSINMAVQCKNLLDSFKVEISLVIFNHKQSPKHPRLETARRRKSQSRPDKQDNKDKTRRDSS